MTDLWRGKNCRCTGRKDSVKIPRMLYKKGDQAQQWVLDAVCIDDTCGKYVTGDNHFKPSIVRKIKFQIMSGSNLRSVGE